VSISQDRTHQPENAGSKFSNYAQILLKAEGLNINRLEQKTRLEFLLLPLLIVSTQLLLVGPQSGPTPSFC